MITNLDEYYKVEFYKTLLVRQDDDYMNDLTRLRPIKYIGQDLHNSNVDLIEENFINLEENLLSDYSISLICKYFVPVIKEDEEDTKFIKYIHKGEDGKFYIINYKQFEKLFLGTLKRELKLRRDEHKDDKTE